jgi:hypothetical protein
MGCDIHAIIEYYREGKVWAFSFDEMYILRDYNLFEALAGVPGTEEDDEEPPVEPLIPPRGLPADFSLAVEEHFFLEVTDHQIGIGENGRRQVSREEAEWWVSIDQAFYLDREPQPRSKISNRYYHTPGWLTRSEILASLRKANWPLESLSGEFHAVLAAMGELERHFGEDKVRLVFWFDG